MESGSSRMYFRAVTRRPRRCLEKVMPWGWTQGLGPAGGLTRTAVQSGAAQGAGNRQVLKSENSRWEGVHTAQSQAGCHARPGLRELAASCPASTTNLFGPLRHPSCPAVLSSFPESTSE